jgi:hypothetical protein
LTKAAASHAAPKISHRCHDDHSAADIIYVISLLRFPKIILPRFVWTIDDPLSTRLVGAALLGTAVAPLHGRHASQEIFKALLNLIEGAPESAWFFLLIFVLILIIWSHYWIRFRHTNLLETLAIYLRIGWWRQKPWKINLHFNTVRFSGRSCSSESASSC